MLLLLHQVGRDYTIILFHDQGTEVVNQVNDELSRLMDISKWIAIAYHPLTNGLDECWNRNSIEINLQVSSKLFPVQNMFVSSANIMKFNNLEILQMSLINKNK